MKLKDTPYYKEVLHELTYSFGTYYLFDRYVVAEINEDVVYNWKDNGKVVTDDIISNLYETDGSDIVYITNRVNTYSVKPTDWLQFFKNNFTLKGYGIVNYNKASFQSAMLEKLFFKSKIVRFSSLEDAIFWAKDLNSKKAIAS